MLFIGTLLACDFSQAAREAVLAGSASLTLMDPLLRAAAEFHDLSTSAQESMRCPSGMCNSSFANTSADSASK
jgi:hypothetical protein